MVSISHHFAINTKSQVSWNLLLVTWVDSFINFLFHVFVYSFFIDCEGDGEDKSEENNNGKDNKDDTPLIVSDGPTDNERAMAICHAAAARARAERDSLGHSRSPHSHPHLPHSRSSSPSAAHLTRAGSTSPPSSPSHPTPSTVKPKIWSLAHTATSSSPERRPSPGPIRTNGLSHSIAASFRHAPYDSPMSTLRQWVDGQFHAGIPIPRMAVHPSQLPVSHPAHQAIITGAPTSVVNAAQTPLFSTAMTATAMALPHGVRYPLFAHEAASSGAPSVNGLAESSLSKDGKYKYFSWYKILESYEQVMHDCSLIQ